MDVTKRGFLQGAAALLAGGKAVAAEVEKTVASAAVGLPFKSAMDAGPASPQIGGVKTASDLGPFGDLIEAAREYYRGERANERGINIFDAYIPADIAGLRSVPLHTKMRMAKQAFDDRDERIYQMGKAIGLTDDQLRNWPFDTAHDRRRNEGLIARMLEKVNGR